MRIAIVGAGAMAGYFGAMLARRGETIHFLMRSDYAVVRQRGLTVKSIRGDFQLPTVNVYDDPAAIGPVDLVFIGLKTTSNDAFDQLLPPLVSESTRVLTAQNGLGNDDRLAELFAPGQVAGGLAFICSNRTAPGVIEHTDYGILRVGNYHRGPDELLTRFAGLVQASGVECDVVEDLALAQWQKLVWNVPFNGLSALLDRTVDTIVGDPELRRRSSRLMREVQGAARGCGYDIDDAFVTRMMAMTDRMAPYKTSMHLDSLAGRPIELESIIGEPLRRGRAAGVSLPEMEVLYQQLRDKAGNTTGGPVGE